MSGVHGQVLGHLVRRGVSAAQQHFSSDYMQNLQTDAELYEKAGPDMKIHDYEMLPVVITAVITFLLVASIKYTIGEVMASLTMIESPTSTAIFDAKPPPYADEPDAPIEKEPLMPSEAEADVEVTLVRNTPITAKITTTIRHLQRTGGFFARWRGAGVSIVYHMLHATISNLLAGVLGMGLLGKAFAYVVASIGLARVHMAWTHAMIASPSRKPFWRRMVPREHCKAILLPTLVFAVAQQATFILPLIVAIALGLPDLKSEHVVQAAQHKDCAKLGLMSLRFLAVPLTGIFVAFMILLPATVTLTRIEAALLPEDQETIVTFDREAIVGDLDITARGSSKKIFVEAWRSFDCAARWRLIKLYVKMVMLQAVVVFTMIHLMVAELYLISGDRLAVFFRSATAQIKLEAIDMNRVAAEQASN